MAYNYATQRPNLFTEEGSVLFLRVRDKVRTLLDSAGAFMTGKVVLGMTYDGWDFLACFDRLVELGEIREITGPKAAGQCRVFVRND